MSRGLGDVYKRQGIVHRDLKPENVFLTRREGIDDFVKVLDFGIAKVANGPKRLTRDGEVLGTPHYMSPEQCEGENVDHRTDIYALGVLLYEMLTGNVPHDADTMMGILTKQMYEEPIPPKVRVPQVSSELEQLILRCLDKKPEQRYQTMRELEADLARIAAGARPKGPDTVTLTPTRPPAAPHRRVSPRHFIGAAAIILLVATITLVGTLREREKRVPPSSDPVAEPHLAEPSGQSAAPTPEPKPVQPTALATSAEPSEPKARAAPRKVARRKPKRRVEPADAGTPVILDPWK